MADRFTREEAASEMDRYIASARDIQRRDLVDFLDWMRERFTFHDRKGEMCFACGYGDPATIEGERLFADYFEIDLDKVEQHRRTLLDDLAKKAQVDHG